MVLLLWIYYSAQIFFLGAELTQVYATRYGSGIRPGPNAIRSLPAAQQPPEKHTPLAGTPAGDGRPPATAEAREARPALRSLALIVLIAGIIAAVITALIRNPRPE